LVGQDVQGDVPFDVPSTAKPANSSKTTSKRVIPVDNKNRNILGFMRMATEILEHHTKLSNTTENDDLKAQEKTDVCSLITYITALLDKVDFAIDMQIPGSKKAAKEESKLVGQKQVLKNFEMDLPPRKRVVKRYKQDAEIWSDMDDFSPDADLRRAKKNAFGNQALEYTESIPIQKLVILNADLESAHKTLKEIFPFQDPNKSAENEDADTESDDTVSDDNESEDTKNENTNNENTKNENTNNENTNNENTNNENNKGEDNDAQQSPSRESVVIKTEPTDEDDNAQKDLSQKSIVIKTEPTSEEIEHTRAALHACLNFE
jgi:hypothetical protein